MNNVDRNEKWPVKYKILRFIWKIVWITLFRPTPKRLGKNWRNFLLKLFGATIKGEALVCSSVKILEPWNLEVGDYIAIGENVNIYNYAKVVLGSNVVVSQNSELCTGTHDYTRNSMPLISAPIVIKDYAWVTTKCFIHPGVTIGEGAVIGACSVVTKDMPEWMVCAGHPCKPIKKREFKENA